MNFPRQGLAEVGPRADTTDVLSNRKRVVLNPCKTFPGEPSGDRNPLAEPMSLSCRLHAGVAKSRQSLGDMSGSHVLKSLGR